MAVEPTVLVVSDGEAPAALAASLERQGIVVEVASSSTAAKVLPILGPDLVVAIGAAHTLPLIEVLRAMNRNQRARLAVIAGRELHGGLLQLDREILVAVLAMDSPVEAQAARLITVAKRLAEESSLARHSASGGPVARAPAREEQRRGLVALQGQGPGRRVLSSDRLKAVPVPDLTLPQRGDAPRWRVAGRAHRVALADEDVRRGAAIARALVERGLEVQVVPLDPAKTRWGDLQAHAPEVLIVDEVALTDHGQVWLELFQADRGLRPARVLKLSLRTLFDETTGTVSLKALEKHIDALAAWRHEMPTIIDDEERPTLVGATEESGPHAVAGASESFDDFDDRPTIARVPGPPAAATKDRPAAAVLPADAPARAPLSSFPSEPPTVQLAASVIAESRSFEQKSEPAAAQPKPAHDALPVSREPTLDAESSSPGAKRSRVNTEPGLSRSAPARPAAAALVPSVRSERRPLSDRPRQGSLSVVVGVLALVGALSLGLWIAEERGFFRAIVRAPAASLPSPSAPGVPAETNGGPTPESGTTHGIEANAGQKRAEASRGQTETEADLWLSEPGDALPCEKLVQPPAEVTALTVEAGSLAWSKARRSLVVGDFQAAQRQMCTAVLNHPQSLALEGLAALYLTLRTPREALRWVEQALQVRGDRPKTIELHGDVLILLGRGDEAREAWRKAVGLAAANTLAIQVLAKNWADEAYQSLYTSEQRGRAETLARRAAGLDPKSAHAAGVLAVVSLALGRKLTGERWAERCQALDPNAPACLLARGDLALARGDRGLAKSLYQKATQLAPGDRRAWQKLGAIGGTAAMEQPAAPFTAQPAESSPPASSPAPSSLPTPAPIVPESPALPARPSQRPKSSGDELGW